MLRILFFVAFVFTFVNMNAQKPVNFTVEESEVIFLGKTISVNELISIDGDVRKKKKTFKKNRKKPDNFKFRRGVSKVSKPELEHQGSDPVWQKTAPQGLAVEPNINILGIGDSGSPMDPTGDVGLQYFIQAVNVTDVGIFNKEDGSLVQEFEMSDLWASIGENSAGDPIILFDERSERWFITEFTGPANLLIAVSETSDPMGAYNAYSFSTPNFPDYPKYGLWPEALVVTTNEGGAGTLHQYFIDREALLAGESNVTMQRISINGNNNTEAGFYVSTPVDIDGSQWPDDSRPITMVINDSSWGQTPEDRIELYHFDIDWSDSNNTTVSTVFVPTSPFDGFACAAPGLGFACIPQQGGGGLDGIPEVIMNVPKLRKFATHESMVLSFLTDATDGDNLAAVRWCELRRDDSSDWTLYQEGTFAPEDGLHRFMSSIAMDDTGNIGLGYNVSSPDSWVGVRFSGRFSSDPLGEMTVQEYNCADGLNPIFSGGRFGDYSQMSVDPVDNSTFWFTTEYAGGGSSGVRTRVVSFQLRRDSIDLTASSFNAPDPISGSFGSAETVSVNFINSGNFPVAEYTVAYSLNDLKLDEELISDTLYPGQNYLHTFSVPSDLSAKGEYNLKAFVSHPDDSRLTNDTIAQVTRHLLSRNASIELTVNEESCVPEIPVQISITNQGGDPIQSMAIDVLIDGSIVASESWSGNLNPGASDEFSVDVMLGDVGDHLIEASIIEINEANDEDNSDDLAFANVNYVNDKSEVVLQLTTDEYPGETTWRLTTLAGALIAQGGPYDQEFTTYEERFCLDLDACYGFVIFDSAGDGICCGFGEGSYQFVGAGGDVLFMSTGEFGFQEVIDFCNTVCNLSAEIISTASVNNDGTLVINVVGGDGNYMYSIDGGSTFQSQNVFNNLPAGDYDIVVSSNDGVCLLEESATVESLSDLNEIDKNTFEIRISPNPNNGWFHIEIDDVFKGGPRLEIEILDAQGKLIQTRRISKFNDTYKGQFSLMSYPSGIYFIKAKHEKGIKTVKMTKL